MGDPINLKTKLGYSIKRNKHIPNKTLSVLVALLMITTVFSSITFASDEKDIKAYVGEIIESMSDGKISTFSSKLIDFIKDRIENPRGIFSLSLVTKYQSDESPEIKVASTRMRLILPTSIDVNGDHIKDIRVWVIRRPAIDLRPPAVCWKTTLIIRRLPGMMKIKADFLEVNLEYRPRLISNIPGVDRIRIGYQSPMGEEIPKTCIVSHKEIPHLLYPLKKTTHRVSINPLSILGKEQLNLLFSVLDENDNGLTIQVNHNPAVIDELSIDLSKDRFIRRGQTLEISRRFFGSSNVTVTVKDNAGSDSGYVMIGDVPKKLSLSWFIGRNGYLELNSYNSGVGPVKVVVKDRITLGFTPTSALNTYFGWNTHGLIGLLRDKDCTFNFSTSVDVDLSDLYINIPNSSGLPFKVDLNAALLSLKRTGSATVGGLVLKPNPGVDSISTRVENLEVVLRDCNVDMETVEVTPPPPPPEKPSITITSPDGVYPPPLTGTVVVKGTAKAPEGKQIQYVEVMIDDGEWVKAQGNLSWSYSWDTKTVSDGSHTINARCFDGENYSATASVTVVVDNRGGYPTVTITYPSKLVLVDGVVTVAGTADDTDDDPSALSVNLQMFDMMGQSALKVNVPVNKTTKQWSYDWNTTSFSAGLYTIVAKGYDGKDYSLLSDSVQVWVRLKVYLNFTLSTASIDVKNLGIHGESTGLDVSSFVASGSASFKLSDGDALIEVQGSVDIENTTISTYNDTSTKNILENLSLHFDGYGMILLSNPKIELDLAANLYMHIGSLLESAEITFSVNGTASAAIEFEDGVFKLENGLLDITDLLFDVTGVGGKSLRLGADQIKMNASGSVSVDGKKITLEGYLNKFEIDNFHVDTDFGILFLSGSIDFSNTASLTLEVLDSFSFNLSSSGPGDIIINDPEIGVRAAGIGEVSASADGIEISGRDGYAAFSYKKEDFNASCHVTIGAICAYGLLVRFNESSHLIGNICGPFEFVFTLSADIKIEMGEDWIKITIGGRYRYVKAYSKFSFNGETGFLDVDAELEEDKDTIVINISGIPNNLAFEIEGNTNVSLIKKLYLDLPNVILVNISEANVSFDFYAVAEKGHLLVELNNAQRTLELGRIYVNISDLFDVTIEGNVEVSSSMSGSGVLNVSWNESKKITEIDVYASFYMEVNITDVAFSYENHKNNASVDFKVDQILICGNRTFIVSDGCIRIISHDIDVGELDEFYNEESIPTGFVVKGFMLNITDLADGEINVKADIARLHLLRGLDLYYDGNLSLSASGDVYGEDINIAVAIGEYIETYIAASIGLVSLTGDATATVLLNDDNLSVIATGENLNVDIEETSFDLLIEGSSIYVALEDLDVDFVGDASLVIDLSQDDILVLTMSPSSDEDFICINTLWLYLLGAIELRIDGLTMSGTTTVHVSNTPNILATIYTEGSIDIRMFTLFGAIQFYGMNGNEGVLSAGIDDFGNIVLGFDGKWHIDHLLAAVNLPPLVYSPPKNIPIFQNGLLPKKPLLGDINVDGELTATLYDLGFSYLELDVKETTSFSLVGYTGLFKLFNATLNPGKVAVAPAEFPNIFIYAESFIQIHALQPAHSLFPRPLRNIKGKGFLELSNITISLEKLTPPMDIEFTLDFKTNGEWHLFNLINTSGNRKGHVHFEYSGVLDDFHLVLQAKWTGTVYKTIPNVVRWAVDKYADVNISLGHDDDSGNTVLVTEEAMVTINQYNTQQINIQTINGDMIEIYENGQMVINGQPTLGRQTVQQALESIPELANLRPIHIWIWRPIAQEWMKIWPWPPGSYEDPVLDSEVTLLSRESYGSTYQVYDIDVLPGTKVNYTAWLKTGQNTSGPSDEFTFTFDFDEGNTTEINHTKAEPYIKIHPDFEPVYCDVKTYNITVDVTDGPVEYASDSTKVRVVEDYLRVDVVKNFWNYEDISEEIGSDGKLHGAFIVKNVANETLSNYNLHWNVTANNISWASDLTLEKTEGSLNPGEEEQVNFSFTPPTTPGDYSASNSIIFKDTVQPQYAEKKSIGIDYGLVLTTPASVILPMESGEIKTFENVFWIFSNRYEPLNWEIANVSAVDFNLGEISYAFIPDTGLMQPYDPTSVDLYIDASNPAFKGGTMKVRIQRVGDTYDNDTVTISIVVADQGILNEWVSPDSHTAGTDWKFETSAYDEEPSFTWAVYKKAGANGWSDDLILNLDTPIDTNGCWIRARNGMFLDKLRVTLYNGNTQVAVPLILTNWKYSRWTYISFEGEYEADKVKIAFHENDPLAGFFVHRLHVYEFYFVESG